MEYCVYTELCVVCIVKYEYIYLTHKKRDNLAKK